MSSVIPYLFAIAAVASYASLSPAVKKFQIENIPPFAFIAITMGLLCAFATTISFFFEKEFSVLKLSPKVWVALAFFSFINLVAFMFYLLALARLPVTHYQLLGLLSPVVGGLLAYAFLGEVFKIQYLYGLFFMGIGLFIALRGGIQ